MELLIKNPELRELAQRILRGLATNEDFKSANLEDVRAIKGDTGEIHYRSLAEPIAKDAADAPRTKRYIASDESVDRMGDIIRVKGWQLERFAKNPQALWAHNSPQFPIGTVTDMHKGVRDGRKALLETITYLAEGTSPQADILWKLVDQNVIRAVSVGFLPIDAHWPQSDEERTQIGLGPYGCEFREQEQIELSNCTVPANANALATKSVQEAVLEMVKSGEITAHDAEGIFELDPERRKISIVVPAMPETKDAPDDAITATDNAWYFKLEADGRLRRVKASAAPETEQELIETPAPDKSDDERFIPLEERMAALEVALEELTVEIRDIPAKVVEAVGRSFLEPKALLKRTFEAAIDKVGQRLSQEKLG